VRKAFVLTSLAGLLAMTACGSKGASGGSSPTPSTPPATTAAVQADTSTFGPDGYGGVRLGETVEELKKAGYEVDPDDNPCLLTVDIKGPKGYYADTLISAKDGVYVIHARDPEPTPEGIKLGSTAAEVKKAYPQLDDSAVKEGAAPEVPVPGNAKAYYQMFIKDGKVDVLELRLKDAPCSK